MDFFLVLLKLQGEPKSDEIWHIFRPRPQTFCSHARTRQNIVILKKNLLSTDDCSARVPGLVNFCLQTPETHASYYFFSGMAERRFPKLLHVIDGRRVLREDNICFSLVHHKLQGGSKSD